MLSCRASRWFPTYASRGDSVRQLIGGSETRELRRTSPRTPGSAGGGPSQRRACPGVAVELVADRLQISVSTAKEYLDRIRDKYVEIGRPAPTKVDLLRRAMEDGILAEPSDREGAGGSGA
jgi:hypothetical protein